MGKNTNHFQALSIFTDKLDFIGDVHGCYYTLTDLLTKLGYKQINGVWQHPSRIAVFVGDYIDRGVNVGPTLELIKNMTDKGKALAILGNHELNLIGIFTKDENGIPLRPHHKIKQHKATIENLSGQELNYWIEWFKELPLFLDFGKIRTVHAAWHDEYIKIIKKQLPENKIKNSLFEIFDCKTALHKAVIYTLKGPELPIPSPILEYAQEQYMDFRLKEARIKWWTEIPENPTYAQATTLSKIKETINQPLENLYKPYPSDDPIVIFGHYSMDSQPYIIRANATCIDFGVYKKNFLASYRYNGEDKLTEKNLVWVKHNPKDEILPPVP